jgi:ribosomal protein S17
MPKRILSGVVVSSKSDKTITVNVTRRIKHKLCVWVWYFFDLLILKF